MHEYMEYVYMNENTLNNNPFKIRYRYSHLDTFYSPNFIIFKIDTKLQN